MKILGIKNLFHDILSQREGSGIKMTPEFDTLENMGYIHSRKKLIFNLNKFTLKDNYYIIFYKTITFLEILQKE